MNHFLWYHFITLFHPWKASKFQERRAEMAAEEQPVWWRGSSPSLSMSVQELATKAIVRKIEVSHLCSSGNRLTQKLPLPCVCPLQKCFPIERSQGVMWLSVLVIHSISDVSSPNGQYRWLCKQPLTTPGWKEYLWQTVSLWLCVEAGWRAGELLAHTAE